MSITASKELIATLASAVAIIAFLVSIAMQIGEMRSAIEANSKAIAELRADMRELRGGLTLHLATHAGQEIQGGAALGESGASQ